MEAPLVPEYDPDDGIPEIALSPSVPSQTHQDAERIPCADWKGCAASLGFISIAAMFGLVCAMAGYRYRTCGNATCSV